MPRNNGNSSTKSKPQTRKPRGGKDQPKQTRTDRRLG